MTQLKSQLQKGNNYWAAEIKQGANNVQIIALD